MDTSHLKTFAPEARRQLMEQVERKLDFVLTERTPDLAAQEKLIEALRKSVQGEGRVHLIERVAYTWFNRFAALRYLDAKGWHSFRARVLTPATLEETQPELLRQVRGSALPEELRDWCDAKRIDDLLAGRIPSANPQAEVQRLLVIGVCQLYTFLLPDVFERVDDFTRLLLPDDLLTERSVPHAFQTEVTDADCAEVEVLGWLYQFYISEKKAAVMARKKAVPSEDIPAVTQLFTPHWIVRYLVENSLGRLWLLNRPGSKLRQHMPYYIEGEPETDFLKINKPEEIRLLDPAVGSGHMLTYAFDLLYLIYEEEGYPPTEIPGLILRHNLYGLEICARAAQLAALALIFKAREKSHRFFQPDKLVRPNIVALRNVRFEEDELRSYMTELDLGDLFTQPMLKLLHQFEEAKNFGSLIQPCLDERAIAFARRAIEVKDIGGQLFLRETQLKVIRVLAQAEALTQRYHVVVANPPYMGSGAMNEPLKNFSKHTFPIAKSDLFAMFMVRSVDFIVPVGYIGMINLPSWLFLSSFEELRNFIVDGLVIESLLHMGRGIFGIDWGSTAFILKKAKDPQMKGSFFRLHKRNFQHIYFDDIGTLFLNAKNDHSYKYDFEKYRGVHGVSEIGNESDNDGLKIYYEIAASEFKKIPGQPIAYWISTRAVDAFARFEPIARIGETRIGLITGENDYYLRFWHEVPFLKIGISLSRQQAAESDKRWFPQSKGGNYRRWYGNNETVVNWSKDGHELQTRLHSSGERTLAHNFNLDRIFQPAVTWTKVSSVSFSARLQPEGFLFNDASANLFVDDATMRLRTLAFLNTEICPRLLAALNPTLNFLPGNVSSLPFCASFDSAQDQRLYKIAFDAVECARADWDNFETSWDFRDQPLLRPGLKGATLEASWRNWEAQCTAAIRRMQELETKNNRLFIAAYGLDGELQPEVPEEQITLARADKHRDAAAFLSYAVGCMMGRYSLDQPGLILANAGDTLADYLAKVGRAEDQLTFAPDEDGIVPMLDGDWFEDDIVCRVRKFLRVTFGDKTLEENIAFLEDAIGKDLRKYFLTDFYKDHLQAYKKRPIYWLFQSPQKHFRALVYLHRYTRDTVNTLLNGYLREFHHKLTARIRDLQHTLQSESVSPRDKTRAQRDLDKVQKAKADVELYEREILLALAQRRPEIDLDDGVKTNYPKFGAALAPVPGLASEED